MLKTSPLRLVAKINIRVILLLATLALGLLVPPTARAEGVVQQWARTFNGPTNDYDAPAALAVDGNGDIVISGNSSSLASNFDFYTAKYAGTTGAVLWEKYYNGPGNSDDEIVAMALDASGNVFVTGTSPGTRGYADIYTAKYAAADGALLWEQRYGVGDDTRDFPSALAMDSAGNVVVAGAVGRPGNNSYGYIVKYAAADGSVLWEHPGLGSGNSESIATLALDTNGDVILGGSFVSTAPPISGQVNYDMFTAKLSGSNGSQVWKTVYADPDNGPDIPVASAVAANGDVVLTAWTLNATTSWDFYTARYGGTTGALIWEKRYDSPGHGADFSTSVKLDSAGNAIVTGSVDPGFNQDIYTVKYAAADGATIWETRYDGPLHQSDYSAAVLIDSDDNVIITGGTDNAYGLTTADFYTAKYAGTNGVLIWEKRYNGPGNLGEGASKIAFTPDGGLVVLGETTVIVNNHGIDDITTVKYVPDLTTQPPTLASPLKNASYGTTVPVNFTLPEAATAGTVKLTFAGTATTILTLVNANGTVGAHSFGLDPTNLAASPMVTSVSGPGALAQDLYTVTLSYQDAAGNSAATASSSNVTIDTTPPALSAVTIVSDNALNPSYAKAGDSITVNFTASEPIQTPTVTIATQAVTPTNPSGNTWKATLVVAPPTSEGKTAFSISAKDLLGNTAAAVTATSGGSSIIVDHTVPTLTVPGTQVVEATGPGGADVQYPAATTTDANPVTLTYSQNSTTLFPLGNTQVTVTAIDAAGNISSGSFTVTVRDTTPPVLAISGANPATVEAGTAYLDAGATATDAVAGNLTAVIQTAGNVNTNVVDDYTVTYSVSDGLNTAMASRTVKVRDTIPPTLAILGDNPVTVTAWPYQDAGATASDPFAGNLTSAIQTSSNVNARVVGDYKVTYTVSDGYNTTSAMRIVQVRDVTPPVLTLLGANPAIVEARSIYQDAGATASDTIAGDLTAAIQASGTVNANAVGTYEVSYSVTDGSFVTTTTRTVQVVDTTGPAITHVPDAISVRADATNHAVVPDFTAALTATDNVAVTQTTQDPPAGTVVGFGPHMITLTVADAAQNATACTTTFTVEDGPALPGRYAGLLADAQGGVHAFMELKLTQGRAVTGYVVLDTGRRLELPHRILSAATHAGTFALTPALSLSVTFDGFGHAAANLANHTVTLTANGVLANAEAPSGVPGNYTAVLEPGDGSAPGWLYAVVSASGAIRMNGKLPDGSPVNVNQGSIVDRHGEALVFLPGKAGALLAGQVHFADLAESDFTGELTFGGASCAANGARFTRAPSGLPAGAYPLALTGASVSITSTLTLRPNNTAAVIAPLASFLALPQRNRPASGIFHLTFRDPAEPFEPVIKGSGVFHQKLGIGVGQFGVGRATGRVQLGTVPP